jgi:hypothetical protein
LYLFSFNSCDPRFDIVYYDFGVPATCGGVCYSVKDAKFGFDGCRVCDNGEPPTNLACYGAAVTYWNKFTDPRTGEYFTIQNNTFDWVPLSRNPLRFDQITYCGEEIENQFCFFEYY